jgi:hypothetical protein
VRGFATLTPVLYGGAYQGLLFLTDLYVTEGAQRLCDRLGVPRRDKRFCRLSGDDLGSFAAA